MDGPESPPLPAWLLRLRHTVLRGRHPILFGNTADQVLWVDAEGARAYRGMRDALTEYLEWEGFGIVGWYDAVDGLVFRGDDEQRRFDALYRRAQGHAADLPDVPAAAAVAPGQTASPPGAAPDPAPGAAPDSAAPSGAEVAAGAAPDPRRQRALRAQALRRAVGSARPAALRDPADALAAARAALSQSETPVAVVLDFADLLFADPAQPDRTHRDLLIQLKKAMHTAAFMGQDCPARLRNTLVLISADLGRVPAWLYQDDPHAEPVRVELPDLRERRAFLLRYRSTFAGGELLDPSEATRHAEVLANLSEGMSIWDLEALRRTSVVAQVPLPEPKRLMRLHRFGDTADPWERLGIDRVRGACAVLERRVLGQPAAVSAVADIIAAARVGIDFVTDPDAASTRPRGVFFFVGPTGVGKTELARALSQFIFDDEAAVARFDMSEYQQEHAAERLTGAPPGYVGHEQGGALTNRVLERPFSVLLFDEIEKAHPRVLDRFLQILEDGRLTDGMGRTAHFSHTIIIFTSNLGSDQITELLQGAPELPTYDEVRNLYLSAVRQHFTQTLGRPELLSRIGDGILVFDILRPDVVRSIAEKFLEQLSHSAHAHGLALSFERDGILAAVEARMREGQTMALGGRQIRPLLDRLVRLPLTRWILEHQPPPGSQVHLVVPPGAAEALVSRVDGAVPALHVAHGPHSTAPVDRAE